MGRTPSVRTWFPDEIENTLRAADQANRSVADAICTPEMALYRRGYTDALAVLATTFGLDPLPTNKLPLSQE